MPNTHCLTSGSLGSNELPCPGVNAANNKEYVPAGSKRGVVVYCHGLNVVQLDPPYTVGGGSALDNFLTALKTDGWVVIVPPYPEDFFDSLPTQGLFNDVNADAGHGSRYLATTLHWWDHVVAYIKQRWGNWPIVPFGVSWGGWHAHVVAKNKLSTITAFGSHEAVTTLSALPTSLTGSVDFSTLAGGSVGLDTGAHDLDAVTVPGIIGWGTSDVTVSSAAIQTLYNNAHAVHAAITSNPVAEAHTFSAADGTAYGNWFTATVDPLCPAVF
jgi:hypothetical protein